MQYLGEDHPTPPMVGTTPARARPRPRAGAHLQGLSILGRVATIFQNTSPFFATRVKQSPEAAETARGFLASGLKVIDAKIGSNPFVAGERPTIADCTLFAALEFAAFAQYPIDPACRNLLRWHESFKQRPSAAA